MLSWLTLPGRLPGSGRFLFEQPKQLHGRLPGVGACPGHYGIYIYIYIHIEKISIDITSVGLASARPN